MTRRAGSSCVALPTRPRTPSSFALGASSAESPPLLSLLTCRSDGSRTGRRPISLGRAEDTKASASATVWSFKLGVLGDPPPVVIAVGARTEQQTRQCLREILRAGAIVAGVVVGQRFVGDCGPLSERQVVGAVVAVAISVLGQLLLAVFAGAVVFDDALGGTVTGRIG